MGDDVIFLPTHTTSRTCTGKLFTVEMHHKRVEKAIPGDNVGMNIKGIEKSNPPRAGNVLILKDDITIKPTFNFTAQIQTLDNIANEIKNGYAPIGYVRCGHGACKLASIIWKIRKETSGKKMDSPHSLKSHEIAVVSFIPVKPIVIDHFIRCEGLSRIAFLEGNSVVMLGKITAVN